MIKIKIHTRKSLLYKKTSANDAEDFRINGKLL